MVYLFEKTKVDTDTGGRSLKSKQLENIVF